MSEELNRPDGSELIGRVRPIFWARRDQVVNAKAGGYLCAMYPDNEGRTDLQPMYDAEALDAVAEPFARLRDALLVAVTQNEHDMLMTGEELRACRAALGA